MLLLKQKASTGKLNYRNNTGRQQRNYYKTFYAVN